MPQAQNGGAAVALKSASARVLAVVAVHERLQMEDDERNVRLDTVLTGLCLDIAKAYGCPDGIKSEGSRISVPTDMAIPLALIVNELVTNAVKYAGPPCEVAFRADGNSLRLTHFR